MMNDDMCKSDRQTADLFNCQKVEDKQLPNVLTENSQPTQQTTLRSVFRQQINLQLS